MKEERNWHLAIDNQRFNANTEPLPAAGTNTANLTDILQAAWHRKDVFHGPNSGRR